VVPLPEDVGQIYAGARIAQGEMSLVAALPLAMTAIFLRDALIFSVGYRLGDRLLTHPWVVRMLGASRIQDAQARVRARGPMAVLIGRFSIGVRTSTFLVSGAMGVRPRDFILWDGLALCISTPVGFGLGYLFGDPMLDVILWVAARARWAVPLLFLAVFAAWRLRRWAGSGSH
jgi:membrane protein DedA with SNARE-associated domain